MGRGSERKTQNKAQISFNLKCMVRMFGPPLMAIRTTLQARTIVVYEPKKQRVRVNATSTVIKISTVSKSEK